MAVVVVVVCEGEVVLNGLLREKCRGCIGVCVCMRVYGSESVEERAVGRRVCASVEYSIMRMSSEVMR